MKPLLTTSLHIAIVILSSSHIIRCQGSNTEVCDLMRHAKIVVNTYNFLPLGNIGRRDLYAYTFYQCYEKCFMDKNCIGFQLGSRHGSRKKRRCTLVLGARVVLQFLRFCCPQCSCGVMKRTPWTLKNISNKK